MKINKQDLIAKFDDILISNNYTEVFLFIDSGLPPELYVTTGSPHEIASKFTVG